MLMKCILKPEQWWESLFSCQCGQRDNVVQLSTHICISSTTSIQETQKNYTSHTIRYGRKTICSLEEVGKGRRGRQRKTMIEMEIERFAVPLWHHHDKKLISAGGSQIPICYTPLSSLPPSFQWDQKPHSPSILSYTPTQSFTCCLMNISTHFLPTLHTSSHSRN